MEPGLKKKKLSEVLDGNAVHQVNESDYEANLSKLVDRLSSASLKALLVQTMTHDPSLVLKGYRLAETEVNMTQNLKETVQVHNTQIAQSLRVEVDILKLVPGEAWWNDGSKLEAYKRELESRETNESLNTALTQLSSFFASSFSICSQLLEKGNASLAHFCFKLILQLYVSSDAAKDGMFNCTEEAAFLQSLTSFHSSFMLSASASHTMTQDMHSQLTWLSSNLTHSQNQASLQTHLSRPNSLN